MKAITWCPTGEHPISPGVPRMPAGHVQNEMHHFISRDSHSLAFPNLGKSKSYDHVAQGRGPGVIPDAALAHIPSILLERVTALLTSVSFPFLQPLPSRNLLSSRLGFQGFL